jgi:two-component system response regulator YesN
MDDLDGLALVNEVSKEFPFIKFIILSGYDEPEYIRRSLDLKVFSYLLKPAGEKQLLDVVGQQITAIEKERQLSHKLQMIDYELEKNHFLFVNNFFNDLLNGAIDTKEDFIERSSYLDLYFKQQYYCCVLFSVREGKSPLQESKAHIIYNHLLAIEEIVKNTWVGDFWIVQTSQNKLVVILGSEDIGGRLELVTDGINKFLDVPVIIIVGDACTDITQIWMSYKQAMLAFENHNTSDEPGIIEIKDISYSPGSRFIYPTDKENKLFAYCFHSEQKLNPDELLNDYFNSMEQQGCTIERMRMEIFCFLSLVTRRAFDTGMDNDIGLVLPELYKSLQKCNTRFELENRFRINIEYIRKTIQSNRQEHDKAKIAGATEFLNNNFSDFNMSLEMISDYMQMNPSYFSRFYKKETGQNFIEALTEKRLDKAKSLLTTTNKRIADISEEVGYRNSKYFWNLFRKTFNCSPSEYRQVHIH